jgi:hypothetical protein
VAETAPRYLSFSITGSVPKKYPDAKIWQSQRYTYYLIHSETDFQEKKVFFYFSSLNITLHTHNYACSKHSQMKQVGKAKLFYHYCE